MRDESRVLLDETVIILAIIAFIVLFHFKGWLQ